jgi:hypothetical protein
MRIVAVRAIRAVELHFVKRSAALGRCGDVNADPFEVLVCDPALERSSDGRTNTD